VFAIIIYGNIFVVTGTTTARMRASKLDLIEKSGLLQPGLHAELVKEKEAYPCGRDEF